MPEQPAIRYCYHEGRIYFGQLPDGLAVGWSKLTIDGPKPLQPPADEMGEEQFAEWVRQLKARGYTVRDYRAS
jgi:hypothetical protein